MAKTRSKVERVSEEIHRLIADDAFEDGRLPSEPELTGIMDASRSTVHQAMAKIELGGLIVCKHGGGTFVNSWVKGIHTRLDEVWDFEEMIHGRLQCQHHFSLHRLKQKTLPAPAVLQQRRQ